VQGDHREQHRLQQFVDLGGGSDRAEPRHEAGERQQHEETIEQAVRGRGDALQRARLADRGGRGPALQAQGDAPERKDEDGDANDHVRGDEPAAGDLRRPAHRGPEGAADGVVVQELHQDKKRGQPVQPDLGR
jgi:hypothetical protein